MFSLVHIFPQWENKHLRETKPFMFTRMLNQNTLTVLALVYNPILYLVTLNPIYGFKHV